MATLKNLVDETTNIKNELIECHTNLKNNLIEKGVVCSDTDKISNLVDKIGDFKFLQGHFLNNYLVSISLQDFLSGNEGLVISENDVFYSHYSGYLSSYDIKSNTISKIMTTTAPINVSLIYDKDANSVYLVGGSKNGTNTSSSSYQYLELYNINTNTISRKEDMPIATNRSFTVMYGSDIYILGGLINNFSFNRTTLVYKYNTKSNTYTKLSDMPFDLSGSAREYNSRYLGGIVDDKLYIFGPPNHIGILDLKTGVWELKTNTFDNNYYTFVSYKNSIYAVGGMTSASTSVGMSLVKKYNHLENTWTELFKLGYDAHSCSLCATSHGLAICGGFATNYTSSALSKALIAIN